jgi:hypothetical protein
MRGEIMTKVKFEYGNDISNVPIEEGSIKIIPNTQSIYFDLDNKRFNISDLFFVDELPEDIIEGKLYIQNNGQIFTKINNKIIQLTTNITEEDIENLKSQINAIDAKATNIQLVDELPNDEEAEENVLYILHTPESYNGYIIDDEHILTTTTYSSSKIEARFKPLEEKIVELEAKITQLEEK